MSVPKSVLEAIKSGIWNYEPETMEAGGYRATRALPGTEEKVDILSERLQQGLPLWHPEDRLCFDERDEERLIRKPR